MKRLRYCLAIYVEELSKSAEAFIQPSGPPDLYLGPKDCEAVCIGFGPCERKFSGPIARADRQGKK
jgi:hypothetical protein